MVIQVNKRKGERLTVKNRINREEENLEHGGHSSLLWLLLPNPSHERRQIDFQSINKSIYICKNNNKSYFMTLSILFVLRMCIQFILEISHSGVKISYGVILKLVFLVLGSAPV